MNKKAAFIKYIHSLGNSTPEEKFTGLILTLNRQFPKADQIPTQDTYNEEMTLQSLTETCIPWEIEVPAGKHRFRFTLSGGSTWEYECYIGDAPIQIDNWKEEISHTDIEGQKDFTMVTEVYLSTQGIHYTGYYTQLYAEVLDDKLNFVGKRFNQYANKFISTIEII